MDHHHHHHGDDMAMTSTESNWVSTPLVSHHEHHEHHEHHHSMTFQLWTTSKLLVESWSLDSLEGLVTAMVFSALLSVVYEGSKFYYHIGKILHRKKFDRWQGTLVAHYVSRMWKALAYMIHFLIGYILMLCSMSYNVWILVAVCLGAGIGYFFLLPLIQHVLHRNTDHEARAAREHVSPLITYRSNPGRSGRNTESVYSKIEEDSLESQSDVLLRQISNIRITCVERETVL